MITFVLMGLNVFVFVVMVLCGVDWSAPEPQAIFNWGGLKGDAVVGGQWWRFFSYMFLHIGLIHLASNMYALFMIGRGLERLIGKWLFFLSYVVTGIFAGLFSFVGHKETLIVSAGASGAIAGIFALFFVFLLTPAFNKRLRQNMLKQMGIIFGINLWYGLTSGSNVDHYAHIGGLISGALLGALFAFYRHFSIQLPHRQKELLKVISVIPLILVLVVTPVVVNKNKNLDQIRFFQLVEAMTERDEEFAKRVMLINFEAPPKFVAIKIREIIFPEIERTNALTEAFNQLVLTEKLAKLRDDYNQLMSLRNEVFLVLLKSCEEEDESYDAEIEELKQAIHQLVKKITVQCRN